LSPVLLRQLSQRRYSKDDHRKKIETPNVKASTAGSIPISAVRGMLSGAPASNKLQPDFCQSYFPPPRPAPRESTFG